MRVSGDPDPATNGLFYLYSDHLGSASAMQKDDGSAPTITRYTPFGDYRADSGPNAVTDRGFTGQRENMDGLGVYYYNARFYVPYLNRFLSADSIVPNPANPQSFNRYSYVLNRPLNFSDPTGHRECGANDDCSDFVFAENIRLPGEVPMLNQLANAIGPYTSCGPTALTMVLQYLGIDVDPSTVIDKARNSFGKDDLALYTPIYPPFTSPEHLTELANSYSSEGINVKSGNFGPNDNQKNAQNFLRDELRQGHP
ncbi:MAG: C39 family peptidase, partial [Anaerolineales bacterium]|nr:C39 family peptidase [Anaerolineales bacterium]